MRTDSGPPQGTTARRTGHTATPERAWWNSSLNRLARTPSIDPAEFDRASHDEARGASSRVWRAYQEVIREAGEAPLPLPLLSPVVAEIGGR